MLSSVFPHPSQNENLYFFPDLMTHIPYKFCMKLCKIFLLTENISKYWIWENMVFHQFSSVCGQISHFLFQWIQLYIFYTFENIKFSIFSWHFNPFPNPSWLCQPIPYLSKALNIQILFLTSSRFSLPVGTRYPHIHLSFHCGLWDHSYSVIPPSIFQVHFHKSIS